MSARPLIAGAWQQPGLVEAVDPHQRRILARAMTLHPTRGGEVVFLPEGAELDPLNSGTLPLLLEHGRNTVTAIGVVEGGWLFPGDVAYVWHAGVHAKTVIDSLEAAGFAVRSQIVWSKSRFVLGRGDYHWQHEPCLYLVRKGATGHWQGARDQATVWAIAAGGDEDTATVHGTQKPVECMRRPMVNNSAVGDAVYEPFSGSGSTIIAAETIGRVCFAIDLDPRYVDVAVERWRRFTGKEAVLVGDGRSFPEVAAARTGRAAA